MRPPRCLLSLGLVLFGAASTTAAARLDLQSQRSGHAVTLTTIDTDYRVNITLGGQTFSVELDSGSSDLWVVGTVLNAKHTGAKDDLSFLDGTDNPSSCASLSGPMKTAVLELAGYTVRDQAFLKDPVSGFPEGTGILGIGPHGASKLRAALHNMEGDPPLDRILGQNIRTSKDYFTVFLNRLDDAEETTAGTFTIGETIPDYDSILKQPKIKVTQLPPPGGLFPKIGEKPSASVGLANWQGLLDEDGIIGPDGKPLNISSVVHGNPDESRQVVIFDTGTTFSIVQASVAEQIYSAVDGATFIDFPDPKWLVPCDAEVNITFKVGGQLYPIHPLDATFAVGGPDNTSCYGAFQPASQPVFYFDLLLGDAFLKNAYMLINAGNSVDGSRKSTPEPYIQLLSITDPAKAHLEFVAARLNGNDTTPDAPTALLSGGAAAAATPANMQDCFFQRHKTALIILGIVGAGLLLLLLAAGIFATVKWHQAARRTYRPLHEPAPAGDIKNVVRFRDC
ncbi:acid protease [Auriscalpium vulgare]|uniref:Acid protease n=1 Tax=Auriscalpium vulgare TaxID=40419 RepID=A0ACB8RI19_9AGAM|nr:acid protease [Auriscalpium vulgare]